MKKKRYEPIETLANRLGISLLKLHELRIHRIVRTRIDYRKDESHCITYCADDAEAWVSEHNVKQLPNND